MTRIVPLIAGRRIAWAANALFAILVALLAHGSVAAEPTQNDDFPGETIPSVSVTLEVDMRGATAQPGEPFGANEVASVWYTYTPPSDTSFFVALENATAPAFFNVYTGESLDTLVKAASGSTSSRTTFPARGGERLAFQVGPVFGSEAGTAALLIHASPPPPNDVFPGATITELPFYDVVDTHYATVDPGEPSLLAGTVWYTFTAPEAMTLAADTWDSNFRAGIALVTPDTLHLPGGSDRGTFELCDEGRVASRTFNIAAGETVWFQVGGRGPQPSERGRLVFNLNRLNDGVTRNPRCRVSDPTHPLQVNFGPLPGAGSMAFPSDLTGGPTVEGLAAVVSRVPRAGRLAPADAGTVLSATADVARSGSFYAQVAYAMPDDRQIDVASWTKSGDFLLVVPSGSPVVDIEQTFIAGAPAVTLLTSTNVVGPGQNHVWVLLNGVIYSFDFAGYGYNDRAAVLELAERAVTFLQLAPPSTGNGPPREREPREGQLPVVLASLLLLLEATATLAARRRPVA
jgi:hypothetical protein